MAGTAAGVAALTFLPGRALAVFIAGVVLVGVGVSLLAWQPTPTRAALLTAGLVSGAFGTAAAIGGPLVALLYQHRPGPTVRATLGAYFSAGSVLAVAGLVLGGQVHPGQLRAALTLLPFTMTGFLLSGPLR
ncbi:MAG: hypothetical protein ACRDQA_00640 [Nocardioidaceae bacterium]